MKCSFSIKKMACKATSILTVVFFILSGTSIPTSFADLNQLTLNEAQQTPATLTLEQANAQASASQDTIPSGVAIQPTNPLSSASSANNLPVSNDCQPAGLIFTVHQGESIQSAIDQAHAGDTVSLDAGNYYEKVVLKQGVNLTGGGCGDYHHSWGLFPKAAL